MSLDLAVMRLVLLLAGLVAVVAAVVIVGTDRLGELLTEAAESRWGALAFVGVYAVAVVAMVPGTVGTLTSGVVFGFATGFAVSLIGATLGAMIAFGIAKALGRDGTERLLGPRLSEIDEWVGRNDFASMLVLRLMPIVPFNGLNYAAGLSAVRFSRYVPATVLGMIPGTALATFVASRAEDPSSPAFIVGLMALGLAAAASAWFGKRFTSSRETADV